MGGSLILNFKLTPASGTNFQPGDRIWISAAQVRPDYSSPFDIEELFKMLLPAGETLAHHGVSVLPKIHDRSVFSASDHDTYELTIPTTMAQVRIMRHWLRLADPRHLQIAVELGNANFLATQRSRHGHSGLPLFYVMGRVEKPDGTAFGIPATGASRTVSQTALVDDFQFCVFLLSPAPASP